MVKGGVIPLKLVMRQQPDHERQIRLAQMNIRKITIARNPSKQSAEVNANIKQYKASSMYSANKACLDTVLSESNQTPFTFVTLQPGATIIYMHFLHINPHSVPHNDIVKIEFSQTD